MKVPEHEKPKERSLKFPSPAASKKLCNFLNAGINGLTREILKTPAVREHKWRPTYEDVRLAYARWNGHCAYCGFLLSLNNSANRLHIPYFKFYVPLSRGGKLFPTNIIPVCGRCFFGYSPRNVEPDRLPGVNAVPDLIEQLILRVKEREELKSKKDPGAFDIDELIRRLKWQLNEALRDMALCFHYRVAKEVMAPGEIIRREENAFGDQIQALIQGNEKAKEEIDRSIRQVVFTREYEPLIEESPATPSKWRKSNGKVSE